MQKTNFFGPEPEKNKIYIELDSISFYDIDEKMFEVMDRFIDEWARLTINPTFKYSNGCRLEEEEWLALMSDVYAMYELRYRKRLNTIKKAKKEALDE